MANNNSNGFSQRKKAGCSKSKQIPLGFFLRNFKKDFVATSQFF